MLRVPSAGLSQAVANLLGRNLRRRAGGTPAVRRRDGGAPCGPPARHACPLVV